MPIEKSKMPTRTSGGSASIVSDRPTIEEFGTSTEVLRSHLQKTSASGYPISLRRLPETGKSVSHAKTLARA